MSQTLQLCKQIYAYFTILSRSDGERKFIRRINLFNFPLNRNAKERFFESFYGVRIKGILMPCESGTFDSFFNPSIL